MNPIVDLKKEKWLNVGKTPQQVVTTVQAPNAETQEFINNTVLQPINERMRSPISVIGYDPDEERKRREKEIELNEAKRREAGLYNAVALIGDSLSAALGGNVWQRDPDRVAAQAKADNERLRAEQKNEDAHNAALQYQYAKDYANTINQAVQPYLTKMKETTGGQNVWQKQEYNEQQQLYQRRMPAVSAADSEKKMKLAAAKAIAKSFGLSLDEDGYVSIDIPWQEQDGNVGRKTIRARVEDAVDYLQAHGHELTAIHNQSKKDNRDLETELDKLAALGIYDQVKGKFDYNQLKNHLVNTPGTEDSQSALTRMWQNSPDYTSGGAKTAKPTKTTTPSSGTYKPKTKKQKKTGSSGF